MEITRSMDRMTRTTREMAEAQRASYEAAAENLAAFQRRNAKLAEDGFEFLKLQESNARAAQEWWASSVKLLQIQQRNVKFAQDWVTSSVQFLQDQLDHNRNTAETFAQSARAQQEGFRALTEEWARSYQNFFSPFTYAREGLRTAQQATRQGLEATQQATRQGLRLAQEATEQTEQAIRQTERATRQAELETTVASIFKTKNYNDLTVDEVSKKLNGLSVEDLKKVREYEKQNKNRETLIEQIDRKLKDVS